MQKGWEGCKEDSAQKTRLRNKEYTSFFEVGT
jgi:hypothetical protein